MTLDKVIVWRHNDGSIAITSILSSSVQNGETEDQAIEREISKLKSARESLNGATVFIKDKSEFKDAINLSQTRNKRSIKIKPDGSFYYDPTYKSSSDIYEEKKEALSTKLKSLNLTDSEIEFLIDKK